MWNRASWSVWWWIGKTPGFNDLNRKGPLNTATMWRMCVAKLVGFCSKCRGPLHHIWLTRFQTAFPWGGLLWPNGSQCLWMELNLVAKQAVWSILAGEEYSLMKSVHLVICGPDLDSFNQELPWLHREFHANWFFVQDRSEIDICGVTCGAGTGIWGIVKYMLIEERCIDHCGYQGNADAM